MRTGEDVPIYKIRTVSVLTGVPMGRIRSWETEYELLCPARTAGGHRLYSIRDVNRIRDIRRLVKEEGISLQAVRKWLKAPPEDQLVGSTSGRGK